jgi:hypothetical protein
MEHSTHLVDTKAMNPLTETAPQAFTLPDGSINLHTLSLAPEGGAARAIHVDNAGQPETCPPPRNCFGVGVGTIIGTLYSPPAKLKLTTGFRVSPLPAGAFELWSWTSLPGDHVAYGHTFTPDHRPQSDAIRVHSVDPMKISRIESIAGRQRFFMFGSLDGAIRVVEHRSGI